VCMISAGDHQGGCVCENNALLRIGTDNVELSSTFAPRPFIHPTATGDWTHEYLEKGYPETLGVYRLFGAEENVKAVRFNAGHNYALGNREAMYNFFNQHLKLGAKEPVREQKFEPIAPKDLSVFDDQHPRPSDSIDIPGMRKYLAEVAKKQMAELRPKDGASLAEYRKVMEPGLRHIVASSLPKADDVTIEHEGDKVFVSGAGSAERLPVAVLRPAQASGPITIVIHPAGKTGIFGGNGEPGELAKALLAKGHLVAAPDIFMTGTLAGPNPMTTSKVEFFAGYNRTVIANRVHDILTEVAAARKVSNEVYLVGLEGAGPWVMLASALAGDAVKRTAADANGFEFANVKDRGDVNFLPGAMRYGGLYNLSALAAPGEMMVFNAGDSDTAPLMAAYAAAGASTKCRVEKGKVDVVEWLTR